MRYLLTVCSLFLLVSCVKNDFDEPPAYEVTLEPNTTIAELKAMYTDFSQNFIEIEDDIVIDGVVVSSDRTGNFFQEIVIQDETGGLFINIASTDLHAVFPLGRKVYIDCQGLVLGDFAGLKQLGGSYSEEDDEVFGIEETLIEDHIQPGTVDSPPAPEMLSITEATSGRDHLGTLIQLNDVEFIPSDTAATYATVEVDPVTGVESNFSENRILTDCQENEIVLRNSGFADFALDQLPDGNGSVTAVLSIFEGTYQLTIRDTDDVQLTETRCDGGGGGGGELISIQDVRDMYTGSASTLPANRTINGVVISDQENSNITDRNLVLQEQGGAGIVVRFVSAHNFPLGTDLEVSVGGAELSEFNGLLQINNVDNVRASASGQTSPPAPELLTIQEIQDEFEALESELVTIEDVTISKDQGNTYEFVTTLDDGTATIDMFTTPYATFAGDAFPTGEVDITGIVSQGGSEQARQISIRNPALDIEGGGGSGGDEIFFEDFQTIGDQEDVTLSGWTNVPVEGERIWRGDAFQGDISAQATAYNDEADEMITWLVTPGISLDENADLTFESATAFWTHDALTAYVSTDFSGDVTAATWDVLNVELPSDAEEDYEIVESGPVDLSDYTGNTIYVGFKYEGSGPSEMTSTYQVDDIKITKQ